MILKSCLFLIVVSVSRLNAQSLTDTGVLSPPAVQIAGSQSFTIASSITKEKYDIYVYVPRSYGDTTRVFPVIYSLDGQWDFTLIESIFGQQYYDGFLPQLVVVGITWNGPNPNYDYLRAMDLTPTTSDEMPLSGKGPKFLQFIKSELIPFIESRFRVRKDDRTLIGSSLGGLFTLYTLFKETNLFERYVLTSPAVQWDNGVIYNFESEYHKKNSQLPVKLFMAIGEYEDVTPFQRFVDVLKSREYGGLSMQTMVLAGTGHSGTKAEGFARGLQFVYARPDLMIDSKTLERYSGTYQTFAGASTIISVEDGHLMIQESESTRHVLSAETDSDFYVRGTFEFVHLNKDSTGKTTGFLIRRFNGNSSATRVEN